MEKIFELATFNPLIDAFQNQFQGGMVSLVLFGSRARAEGSFASDCDLLLVAKELPLHPFERQIYFRKIVPRKVHFQVSIYAKTVEEFEKNFPPIYLDIAADGVILFDTDEYIHKKLQQVRALAERAGLVRGKKSGIYMWEWKKSPGFNWRIDWGGVYGLERGSKLQTKAP
jgi:predicted nucleotidyltransferase